MTSSFSSVTWVGAAPALALASAAANPAAAGSEAEAERKKPGVKDVLKGIFGR